MAILNDYPGESTSRIGAHFLEVSRIPILKGYLQTVSFSSQTEKIVQHSLGRSYTGMLVVAVDDPDFSFQTKRPSTAKAAGIRPEKYIPIYASASFTGSITVWIF